MRTKQQHADYMREWSRNNRDKVKVWCANYYKKNRTSILFATRKVKDYKTTNVYKGRVAEIIAVKKLSKLGRVIDLNKDMRNKLPYDLTFNNKKVDVKMSTPFYDKTKRRWLWKFHTKNNTVPDLFYCIGYKDSKPQKSFLIPNKGISHIPIYLDGNSKYLAYQI